MSYVTELKKMGATLEPLKKALDSITPLNQEQIETLYAAAYGFYEIGEYAKSGDLFTHLILHDPFEERFWKGLASSRQMKREYKAALHAWSVLCLIEKQPSAAQYHAAECLLSLGDREDALKALRLALRSIGEGDPLLEKITHLQERMENHGRS